MGDTSLPPLSGPLGRLGDAALSDLVAAGTVRRHAAGESLMIQGGASDSVHVLLEGRVRVTVIDGDGHELLLDLLGPGDTVGELSVIDGRPRSATVTAIEPGRALRIAGPRFVQFLQAHPRAVVALLRVLVERLRDSDEARLRLVSERTDQRVARRLLELAAEHGEVDGDAVRITAPLTQAELAAWVGASREGVSYALRDLREAGVITVDRRAITVHDLPSLRERALG